MAQVSRRSRERKPGAMRLVFVSSDIRTRFGVRGADHAQDASGGRAVQRIPRKNRCGGGAERGRRRLRLPGASGGAYRRRAEAPLPSRDGRNMRETG